MPRRRVLPSILLPLLLLALAPAALGARVPLSAINAAPTDRLEPCRVPGEHGIIDALCGFFGTWENRTTRTGRKIRLKVVVLPAHGAHRQPDPVFFLGGGPGEAVTGGAGETFDLQQALRADGQDRDFVFIDQRGTGEPDRLGCTLGANENDLQTYLGAMFPVAAVRACRAELERKYDLTRYTTDVAMDDLEDARAWLGYGRINLSGGSYGTRAAQVFLRRHPDSVRSMILSGVVPLDETAPLSHAAAGQRSLDLVLAWCAQDPACHASFPRLQVDLAAVLERLAAGPVEVEIEHPVTHVGAKVKVSREIIADGIRWQLYTRRTGAALPRLLHAAAGGEFSPLAQATVRSRLGLIQGLALGLFFSVTCAEDIPFIAPEQIAARTAGSFLSDYRVREQMGACAVWPRADVPPRHQEAVHSNVPVLLVSGERDPVTPPAFAERVARSLANSLRVVVPYGAHDDETPCIEDLEKRFIEHGAVHGLDTSCLAKLERTPFEIEAPRPHP